MEPGISKTGNDNTKEQYWEKLGRSVGGISRGTEKLLEIKCVDMKKKDGDRD